MRRRWCALVTASVLAVATSGCGMLFSGPGPVIEVTTSYPGATAETVADTVAEPLELQINGVEGMLDMESESRKDGTYRLRIRFKRGVDPATAITLVMNRQSLAMPVLPDPVQRTGMTVKRVPPDPLTNEVAIVVEDQGDLGHEKLQRCAADVGRQLKTEGGLVTPVAFPGPDEKQIQVILDREKCRMHGVAPADVLVALESAGTPQDADALKGLTVTRSSGEKVPLAPLVEFKEVMGATAVYRRNMHRAVRISGLPPAGSSSASAGAAALKRAETLVPAPFRVERYFAR
jgi:multidrug efflux pump subunit AcrB